MKRWILLAGIVLLCIAAVFVSERKRVDVSASPSAVLFLVADSERELTRMPVSFTRMSDQEEIRIGNQLAKQYAAERERENHPEDAEVERYLTQVGWQLASHAHRKLPYQFHYIPDPYFINAFALPGGHVYVGEGLISLMDSEDELASVMGHELEHIDHYHCAERVQQEQAIRKIPLGGLIALPVEVFEAGYSKDQELEADREGTRLSVEAGYSAEGAVRMFETFNRLYRQYQSRARTPQEEMSQVALETLEGYFRSHPLPSERIAQVQKMIASENWPIHPERDLAVGYIFWTTKAQQLLDVHKYLQAEQLASHSLQAHPEQARAWGVLARAQFAQAKFAESAASYRKLLDSNPVNSESISGYALALAGADRRTAASQFSAWIDTVRGDKPIFAEIERAGLLLLDGDSAAAEKLQSEVKQNPESHPPESVGELGWWYYLAGNYDKAVELSSAAVQQRPQDLTLQLRLAWTEAETRRYEDALQTLNNSFYQPQDRAERTMARAVVRWRAMDNEGAMQDFGVAIADQPEWGNPNWVKALYAPLVADTIQQMSAEAERRKKKARALAGRVSINP